MECGTICGSSNWYLSQILDCSWDDRVAYGSLNNLVIFEPPHFLKPTTINHVHSSRILSTSFPLKSCGNSLLSTSESGEMFVWNLDTLKVSMFFRNPQKCMTYGSWSHANDSLIVCADENGNLLKWKIDSNTVSIQYFKGHSFAVVACCPHDQDLVATGTKHGLVCIINVKVTGKEFIVHKLRGHDSEVVSLSWCPVRENVINSSNKGDCLLLASGAKEKKVFFWRAGQDGLYEAYSDMPLAPRIHGAKMWTCVCWYQPDKLLASSIGGEVFSLNVGKLKTKKSSNSNMKWERFSDNHMRGHIVVKSSPWKKGIVMDDEDWRAKDLENSGWVWTCGSDRVLAGIPIKKQNATVKLNTIGGPVHAMVVSPIDGTSLAIGVADKSIRVVNLSEPNLKTMQTFNQKVSGKVMSLSWHPSKDGWLSYGTSDGRIGIQFTCTVKLPLLFQPFTKDSIYALEWGPSLAAMKSYKIEQENSDENVVEAKPSQIVLYAVGGGRVVAMDPHFPDKIFEEPFKDILKTLVKSEKSKSKSFGITDLAWKPDNLLLALGDERGSIHLLYRTQKEELMHASTFQYHTELIQDIMWHPSSCTSDKTGLSAQAPLLATVSNNSTIRIVDTSVVLDALSKDHESLPVVNVPCIASLKGHKSRVSKVAWSPHEGGRLLSVSYDQCAQVWDVINLQPLSCFTQHSAPLYSCLWSPFNPNIAITAGQDGKICLWNALGQEDKVPIVKSKDGQHLLKEAKEARSPGTGGVDKESHPEKAKKRREKALLPLSGPAVLSDEGNLTILRRLLHPPDKENLLSIADLEGHESANPLHYAFFGDQTLLSEYLVKESRNVSEENCFTLNIWRGSPKEAIISAIEKRCLNDYFVSIAPTVSHKFWTEACAAYAEQLKEANEFSKASAYLLAIHKVTDAINLLVEHGKYRHALAVARCRLPSDDLVVKKILTAWADFNVSQGRFCLAAVCWGSAGDWEEAARCLARKKCPERLLLAAQIMSEKSSDSKTGTFYAHECFDICLTLKDWNTIKSLLSLYPILKHLTVRAHVHEVICDSMNSIKPDKFLQLSDDKGHVVQDVAVIEGEGNHEPTIFDAECVAALQSDLVNEISVNNEDSALLAASRKVTLAFLAAPSLFPSIMQKFVVGDLKSREENVEIAFRHLVQAMALLYNFHVTYMFNEKVPPILLKFCIWLSPQGSFDTNSVFSSPVSPLQCSLRAYLAAGLLMWMVSTDCEDQNKSTTLSLFELFKEDIFSIDSLKWFKVEFKLKCLHDNKTKHAVEIKGPKAIDEHKISSEESKKDKEISDVPSEELASLNLNETVDASNSAEVLSDSKSDLKSPYSTSEGSEYHLLKQWLQEFTEKREKVPNPYLSYSHLVQFLKTFPNEEGKQEELLSNYSRFWEEKNSLVDI